MVPMVANVDAGPSGSPGTVAVDEAGPFDRLLDSPVAPYVLPVVAAVALVIGLALTVSRVGLLIDWSERYDGAGEHVVFGCETAEGSGGDQWRCDGALVPDGSTVDVRADLVSSRGAIASSQPFVGERTDVFYDREVLGTVHPVPLRLNELTRLYLSVLPRLLLAGGAALWLAGWALTRGVDAADLLERDRVRAPGRFAWRRRGVTWLVAAVGSLILNHLLTSQVLGSLGTF